MNEEQIKAILAGHYSEEEINEMLDQYFYTRAGPMILSIIEFTAQTFDLRVEQLASEMGFGGPTIEESAINMMKTISGGKFREHLEHASKIVDSWPDWKKKALGR